MRNWTLINYCLMRTRISIFSPAHILRRLRSNNGMTFDQVPCAIYHTYISYSLPAPGNHVHVGSSGLPSLFLCINQTSSTLSRRHATHASPAILASKRTKAENFLIESTRACPALANKIGDTFWVESAQNSVYTRCDAAMTTLKFRI